MTFVLKSERIDNRQIEITQEKFEDCYHVIVCEKGEPYWHKISDRVYPSWRKACQRFNSIKTKIKKEVCV